MKFTKLAEKQLANKPTCCFEEWSAEEGRMVQYGEPAVWSLGANCKNPLCSKHGKFVGSLNTQNMDIETRKEFRNDG